MSYTICERQMMNNQPLVSIITPSYNQAKYVAYTIQSVTRQDYPFIEYGVVDGGSTDGSVGILRKFEDHLDWWVSEPDQGQADAVNKGIAKSTGSIVAWLNSDDILLPGAVQRVVDVFSHRNVDMVFGDAITINAHGVPLSKLDFGDWDLEDLMRFRVICQPAVFLKKTVWDSVGGLDQSYHFMLDHQLWIRVAAQYNIHHIPRLLAGSRYHRAAKNVAHAADFSEEIFRVRNWMRQYPGTGEIYQQDTRRIEGGAYRLSARYLLEGGLLKKSLLHSLRAVWNWPGYGLQHWHRLLFAVFALLTGTDPQKIRRSPKSLSLNDDLDLANWPGLSSLTEE